MGNTHADVLSTWFTYISHGVRYAVRNTSCFQNVNRDIYIYIYIYIYISPTWLFYRRSFQPHPKAYNKHRQNCPQEISKAVYKVILSCCLFVMLLKATSVNIFTSAAPAMIRKAQCTPCIANCSK
jgi:hypothetical protein